jgi:hypothetical protein
LRISTTKVLDRVVCVETSKNEDTWCGELEDFDVQNKIAVDIKLEKRLRRSVHPKNNPFRSISKYYEKATGTNIG